MPVLGQANEVWGPSNKATAFFSDIGELCTAKLLNFGFMNVHKAAKSDRSFVMPVCLSVLMRRLCSYWTELREMLCCGLLFISAEETPVWLKSEKKTSTCHEHLRTLYAGGDSVLCEARGGDERVNGERITNKKYIVLCDVLLRPKTQSTITQQSTSSTLHTVV